MAGTISIDGDNVVFQLKGVDEILAIKSKLSVPINHIISVSTEKADWNYFNMVKVAGARIPGMVADGRFLSKEGLLFYEMHDPNKCITVELKEERYKKIVFEVDDKEKTANEIRALLK